MNKKENEIRKLYPGEELPLLDDLFQFRKCLFPLIEHLRFHERDSTTPISAFPIASQLILLLRLCQNYFNHSSNTFIPFLTELSFEIFQNFITNDKGAMNALAFLLSPLGRESYLQGYLQWGAPISSPFFSYNDYLFRGDKQEYYSFGDEGKQFVGDRWVQIITPQKITGSSNLSPYLESILKFFVTTSSSKKIDNENIPTKPMVFNPQFKPSNPFGTVLSSTFSERSAENSTTFQDHKAKLLSILRLKASDLPWKMVYPNERKFLPSSSELEEESEVVGRKEKRRRNKRQKVREKRKEKEVQPNREVNELEEGIDREVFDIVTI
jgi:hypothetical protein